MLWRENRRKRPRSKLVQNRPAYITRNAFTQPSRIYDSFLYPGMDNYEYAISSDTKRKSGHKKGKTKKSETVKNEQQNYSGADTINFQKWCSSLPASTDSHHRHDIFPRMQVVPDVSSSRYETELSTEKPYVAEYYTLDPYMYRRRTYSSYPYGSYQYPMVVQPSSNRHRSKSSRSERNSRHISRRHFDDGYDYGVYSFVL